MIDLIINWIFANYIELIGFVFSALGVWLTTKQKIWCWPISLVGVIIYIYIFFISKLYADFGLQIFYLFMTIYGWYYWLHGGQNNQVLEKISRITKKQIIMYLIIGITTQTILGYLLFKYTDAAFPFWDSVVGIWGIIATYMMAKKILEHWIAWIIIDIMCVTIYFFKDLYLTSILYLIFTLLAILGYYNWRKDLSKQES